jgi:hypothetical protein
MTREEMARNILLCGLMHGREHALEVFGQPTNSLIFMTSAELHKNNTPEEAFVFLIIHLFNSQRASRQGYSIDNDLTTDEILAYIKATSQFREEKRMAEFKDKQLKAVIDDFVYIMSKQFFFQPELFEQIVANMQGEGKNE